MGRENSSHWRALWPEMIMKGFNQDGDEKSRDTETQRGFDCSSMWSQRHQIQQDED